MWGRFQTAATIEAALLLGWHTLPCGVDRTILLCGGALLVLLVSVLALKDRSDASRHLRRIREFERDQRLPRSRWPSTFSGSRLMLVAILVLNGVNLWIFVRSL